MPLARYVRLRRARGWSLATLGPNEARVLFDGGACSVAFALAAALQGWFAGVTLASIPPAALVIPAYLLAAAFAGVYGRLRLSTTRLKLVAVAGALLVATVLALAVAPPALVLTWLAIAAPTLLTARALVGIQYEHRPRVSAIIRSQHGPIVVIGGAGYIGTHLVDQLLKKGYRVRVLDRLMYGSEPLEPFVTHAKFEFVDGDATDISKLSLALQGASSVVHLAGLVGDPACAIDESFTRHTNIVATRMVKEVAQSLGISRFVFASSCSVYGVSDVEVKELDALNPVSLYAQTKIDSERELLHGVPDDFFVTVLRFATVFGHSYRPRFDLVANLFTAQAVADGRITVVGPDQWRPFVHVRDLARAIVMVLEADPVSVQSQIFNVGDSRLNLTIGQLGQLVQRIVSERRTVDLQVMDNPTDRRNYAVSFAKIQRELGFTAETSVEAGVRELVEHLVNGDYADYRNPLYSNLLTTKDALKTFYDPEQSSRLYAPLQQH
jgi:nucleoside-diphosphate-sugar epimerase